LEVGGGRPEERLRLRLRLRLRKTRLIAFVLDLNLNLNLPQRSEVGGGTVRGMRLEV